MKITWYDRLYVGEKAKKNRYRIIKTIRKSGRLSRAYVITPAENGNNLFDIYPACMLSSPFYRDHEFFVVGIAADYWEALGLAGRIVDEIYQKTGGFDVVAFLEEADAGSSAGEE